LDENINIIKNTKAVLDAIKEVDLQVIIIIIIISGTTTLTGTSRRYCGFIA
jgi:hypothetical protein